MDHNLLKVQGQVANNIKNKNLRRAIAMLRKVAEQYGRPDMLDPIEKVEQGYAYMLKYVIDGVEDPGRADMYASFISELYRILDVLIFGKRVALENTLYFSTFRTRQATASPDIPELLQSCEKASANAALLKMVGTGAKDAADEYRFLEKAETDLFNAIFTTPFLSSADAAAVNAAIASSENSAEFKEHIVWATMLSLLFTFDPKKLEALMLAYMNAEAAVSVAALAALLLSLWQWRDRPLPSRLAKVMDTVKEQPTWHSDLDMALMEFLRAFDTARVNKKINDEVIPILRDINSDMQTLIKDTNLDPSDLASLQENPEWDEMLSKSGAKDKLKEITEMQLDGADVMMSTFSHLKSCFPFFREVANWFLPFRANHTQLSAAAGDVESLANLLEKTDLFCDSDKYSFILSLDKVPADQRKFVSGQISANADALADMNRTDETVPVMRQRLANRYMKNIYRFFKLFQRKTDFPDPFSEGVNLLDVPALAPDLEDANLMRTIAEFNFSRGYLNDALRAFTTLDSLISPEAVVYQKIGYVYEKMGRRDQAISFYYKAEMLDPDSLWTLRRLAACSRAIGNYDQAVKYYSSLESRLPNDSNVALRLGYAMLEKGDYQAALNQFYKVSFMDEDSIKPYRPLAWTLFLTGDLDGALKQYARIEQSEALSAGDCLNIGHVHLAKGETAKAVEFYARALASDGFTPEKFADAFTTDTPVLSRLGVDPSLLPLIQDAAMLRHNSQL